ncbi:hypothetical protein L3X38_026858 [Prunus dulcis]|uniref:DUF4216 domain-containing protein n=1 Tax=Prunus dulcis TaxID=3755 RepID=A0AAD4VNM2_PRUDU|nr:hypothetical protein L3X38_026858 [Prunus dulcis]
MAVPLYRSYLIKGIKFNIKAQDDVRTTQNSGVYLLAHTMQVASAKDKNSILSNMGFYGVIQEIWDLVVDELGFTLVDLSKIGHRNDQFVLASQVKQIFFIDDPMHRGWLVVLSMPNREYNDVIGDEVLGDVIIECEPFTRGMPNVDTFDELQANEEEALSNILDELVASGQHCNAGTFKARTMKLVETQLRLLIPHTPIRVFGKDRATGNSSLPHAEMVLDDDDEAFESNIPDVQLDGSHNNDQTQAQSKSSSSRK